VQGPPAQVAGVETAGREIALLLVRALRVHPSLPFTPLVPQFSRHLS
jgi:hypothetical protein